MITLIEIKSFMLNWMTTWIYFFNLRGLNVLLYWVFQNDKRLKYASILIGQAITSGTQNLLTLIIVSRYHKPESSSVLSSEYNGIPCIFCHSRILLKGYMPIKTQHLIRPYYLKSIYHLSIPNIYVFHISIFKVMIMNSFLLSVIFFPGSDTLILWLNPCINSGILVTSVLKRHFWQPLKMEQDPPSWHLVDVIAQIVCII